MKSIRCIIVDDEPLALDLLEKYVKQTPFLQLLKRCVSAIDALSFIQKNEVDLLFLDIQMPDLTGIELSKVIKDKYQIIFTTAFEEYAIEGYKVNALDYLLKPFNYDEFLQAALKAQKQFDTVSIIEQPAPKKQFIFVKSEYKLIKIDFSDMLFIEAMKDYLKIHLASQPKPVLTLMSLTSMEKELPENFLRIHRSYIINLSKIQSVERMRVSVKGQLLPVSDSYKDIFNERISYYFAG